MPEPSTVRFDPRPWDLVIGTAVLAGCGARQVADDAAETSTTIDWSTDAAESGDTETETGVEPECPSDDCQYPPGDWCLYYHCVQFEICEYASPHVYCASVGVPPPACADDFASIPTVLDPGAPPLAIRFVDVDADGQDELVVATETELLVYEDGNDQPAVTELAAPLQLIRAMVGGQFDGQPGEDLVLLVDDLRLDAAQHVYSSNGASGFVNVSVEASPMPAPVSLLATDFDGQAPDDLLLLGEQGAWLYLGGGPASLVISDTTARHAVAFEHGSPHASALLEPGPHLFDLIGTPLADGMGWTDSLAAVASPDEARYAGARQYSYGPNSWLDVRLWDPTTLLTQSTIVIAGVHTAGAGSSTLGAGDFDGDQRDELVVCGPLATFVFDPLTQPCIVAVELGSIAQDHAIGDHDGDGDDELALSFDSGEVVIIDGEF